MKSSSTAPTESRRGARVVNALLRCTRGDDHAAPLFERIESVPGLWVLELGPFAADSWTIWLSETQTTLTRNEALLKSLGPGSTDYTLHITVRFVEGPAAVTIPPSLSQIFAACGITLEIVNEDT